MIDWLVGLVCWFLRAAPKTHLPQRRVIWAVMIGNLTILASSFVSDHNQLSLHCDIVLSRGMPARLSERGYRAG